MKFSILLTTYKRPLQLYFCLKSLRRQGIENLDHEILVLDDSPDHEKKESQKVAETSDAIAGLNVRYVHTGVRTSHKWRTMGFTANIGIQQASGEIVVLTSSDVYHLGQTVRPVVDAVEQDPMAISSVHEVYEDDGSLIDYLRTGPQSMKDLNKNVTEIVRAINQKPRLPGFYQTNPDIPFFLAILRKHLIDLGGYDEDFIGSASEDCDLLDRLKAIGCHYVYAPLGADVIHLYHGRRSIKQLEANPGFAYNIRLRNERKESLIRNQGRVWGELIDPTAPQEGAPLHLVLWVTSRCNLDCSMCNQKSTKEDLLDYSMTSEELSRFISSCQQRGIHFSTIELTGGEPSLWPLFEEGIKQLQESRISDAITFITNGLHAERTAQIANRYGLYYVVSKHQCSTNQALVHQQTGVGVVWNEASHRPVPQVPTAKSLPATCSQRQDMHGRVVRQLFYVNGTIWQCCMAPTNSQVIGGVSDESLRCSFERDFPSHFSKIRNDLPICKVCLCNKKVWDTLEDGAV